MKSLTVLVCVFGLGLSRPQHPKVLEQADSAVLRLAPAPPSYPAPSTPWWAGHSPPSLSTQRRAQPSEAEASPEPSLDPGAWCPARGASCPASPLSPSHQCQAPQAEASSGPGDWSLTLGASSLDQAGSCQAPVLSLLE